MRRVDGEVEPAPVSRGYAPFIDVFVQRMSGHRVYRADISSSIDNGGSWRLGFLLAHCILDDPSLRLACDDEPADLTVFATGDLRDRPHSGRVEILPVSGIDQKLTHAAARIKSENAAGTDVLVLLPAVEAADDSVERALPGIDCDAVRRVEDVKAALSLIRARLEAGKRSHPAISPPAPAGGVTGKEADSSSPRVIALAVAATLLAAIFAVVVLGDGMSPSANNQTAGEGSDGSSLPIAVDIATVIAPEGALCSSPDVFTAPLTFSEGTGPPALRRPHGRLCALAATVKNQGVRGMSLEGALGAVIDEGATTYLAGSQTRSFDLGAGDRAEIRLPFPRFRIGGERFRFVLRAAWLEADGVSFNTGDAGPPEGVAVLTTVEFYID